MKIRKAAAGELDAVMEVYRQAREFMAANGNPGQWGEYYPPRYLIEEDIAQGICYVCVNDGEAIEGVFCFSPGPEASYAVIQGGSWLDERPYHVIHRVAAGEGAHGVAAACFEWCFAHSGSIRIDTHRDNQVMRHLLAKHGFVLCGRVTLADGTERLAYQRIS